MRGASCLTVLLLITLFSTSSDATTIHVPADSSTIQGGINGAFDGDTVLVARGTYHEHDIDFPGKAIVVTGTDPEDSAVVAATVVDGDSLGRVFVFQSREDSSSVLAGLTISHGYALKGGGIYCSGHSSPTIMNCNIVENVAHDPYPNGQGGGIYCNYLLESVPRIIHCIFRENSAGSHGGAMYISWYSAPQITNCTFGGNLAARGGSVLYAYFQSRPYSVTNCIFWGNPGEAFYGEADGWNITYSDVENGFAGVGNIDEDPLFRDGQFHLDLGSPCVDGGDPSLFDACRPPGLGAARSDMGVYGGEENCAWPPSDPGIFMALRATGATTIPVGIGHFPDTVIDQDSFGFRAVE